MLKLSLIIIFFFGLFSQQKEIVISFDEGFWGSKARWLSIDDVSISSFDSVINLITDDFSNNAFYLKYKTTKNSISFKIQMVHFKQTEVIDYSFQIPLKNVQNISFYMGIDKSTCKRVLKYKALNSKFVYNSE